MASAVGLHIDATSIRAALVEGSGRKARIKAFAVHRFEEAFAVPEEAAARALSDLFKKEKLPKTKVIVSVSAQNCVMREISVPFTKDELIRKTIKFQAEGYFHSHPIDDMLVEYVKFGEYEGKSKLLVVAIRKAQIEKRLQFLSRVQIDPVAVDLDISATYNALHHAGVFEGRKSVLVVDLGGGFLKLVVVEDGKLRTARSLRLQLGGGGAAHGDYGAERSSAGEASEEEFLFDAFDEEGAFETGRLPVVILDEGESEIFDLADSGISEETRENYLQKIFLEIDRTLASAQLGQPVEAICLLGGDTDIEGIERQFQEYFQVDVLRPPLVRTMSAAVRGEAAEQIDLEGATAIGLALKGIDYDKGGIDFRQEEFEYQGKFERLKMGLACTVSLLFLIFFLLAFRFSKEELWLHEKDQQWREQQARIYYALFPEKDLRAGPSILTQLRDEDIRLQQEVGQGLRGVPTIVSALDKLLELSQGKIRSGADFRLRDLSLTHGQSSVNGKVVDPDDAIRLVNGCNESQAIRVELVRRVESREAGTYDVELRLTAPEEAQR